MRLSTLLAFGTGLISLQAYDYSKTFFGQNSASKIHSFSDQMMQSNFEQPKIIDIMHKSQQMHFLHNFILQSELNVIHFIKVYFPKNLMQNVLGGNISTMTMEEKKEFLKVHLVFNANHHVQAHDGIIHGGLLATLFDNAFGYLGGVTTGLIPVATAYLNVTYKKPVKINEDYIVSCEVENIDGRKIYMKGQIKDSQGNVYTEANALFLEVNWGLPKWQKVKDVIFQDLNKN